MRRHRFFLKLTLVNIVALLAPAVLSAHGVQRYDNGRWYDGTRFVQRTMWSVDGVFREAFDGEPDSVVDLNDGWVIPPFGDAHHHALEIQPFLSAGIFYVKNPNNLRSDAEKLRSRVNLPESVDILFSHGGLTATGGHPAPLYERNARQRGKDPMKLDGDAYFAIDDESDLAKTWPAILAGRPDFIKIYLEAKALDRKLAPLVVERAHAAGLTVSAHVTTAADFRAAVAAGVDEITHLPLQPLTAEDAKGASAKEVRVVTTTISHRDTSGVPDIDALHRHNIRLLRDHGVAMVIGTDDSRLAVSEAENLLRIGAFDVRTLLRVWTVDTPRAIFPSRRIGRLAEGFEASFLALEANPLEDFGAVRRIAIAVKQGHALKIERRQKSAVEVLAPIAMREGPAAAIAEYDRMRAAASDYDLGENALNALGYAMLRHNAVDGAIEVFRANVERFPQSFNVYDSLGEALMIKGEKDLAIRYYEKSLQLNPKNRNASEMLKKLRTSGGPTK